MTLAGLEIVTHRDLVYAYIVRAEFAPEATTFVTPGTEQLQLGAIVYAAGTTIHRHHHLPVRREVFSTPEAVLVRKGRCTVRFYDDGLNEVRALALGPGDLVLLLRGGHGFDLHEDSLLLEVKQGPHQPDEKKRF